MDQQQIRDEADQLIRQALELPAERTTQLLASTVAPNYTVLVHDPVVGAEGAWLTLRSGRRIFDGVAAYSAANLGHSHPLIREALKAFLDAGQPTVTGRFCASPWLALFAEKITGMTGFDQFLPANGGVEGPETAIKLARRWGYREKGIKGEAEVLYAEGCFHGRTLTVTQMFDPSEVEAWEDFGPYPRGFRRFPFDDLEALEAAITPQTCAILLEPIQGEGGINMPSEGYLRGVVELARRHECLVIFDEVQTGWCRTGTLFRWMAEGEAARPDIMCVGKSVSGGFAPVSGILADKELMAHMQPGSHGSTFGGCPISSAVSLAALRAIELEDLTTQAREKGAYVGKRLCELAERAPRIKEVRGAGLMFGIEIDQDGPDGHAYTERLLELGAIVKDTHHWVLRFTPPIVASEDDLDQVLSMIETAFTEESALNYPHGAKVAAAG